MLALAVGAKIYPIVLLPLCTCLWWRRGSSLRAVTGLVVVGFVSTFTVFPMFDEPPEDDPIVLKPLAEELAAGPSAAGQLLVPATPSRVAKQTRTLGGLQAFVRAWEMNDLIFMVVVENLRPQAEVSPSEKPWFVAMPDSWSWSLLTGWAKVTDRWTLGTTDLDSPSEIRRHSFSLARFLMGGAFAIYACLLAWHVSGSESPREWCRGAMLTLAWFWFTCPTQNPWYWCWVLPLLPFARCLSWHLVSAMSLFYYLRFWFSAHYVAPPTWGTPYDGEHFFYYVVVWFEFLPCLVALAVESAWRRREWKE